MLLTSSASQSTHAASAIDRDWKVRCINDPLLAMAELALCERAEAARSAWGLHRAGRLALALQQPTNDQYVQDLICAVRQYLPGVSIYDCTDSTPRLLTPAHDHVVSEQPTRTGADMHDDGDENDAHAISRDELDMLFEAAGEREP